MDGHEVAVERKELRNLLADMRNEHLRDQLERAKLVTPHVWLLVEGPLPSDLGTIDGPGNWTFEQFWAKLSSLLIGLGVSGPLWTRMTRESAKVIRILFEQSQREGLGSGKPASEKWRRTNRDWVAESYTRVFRGLGFDRALALAKLFPSWTALTGATTSQLQKADGVGPLWAKKIHHLLRQEHGKA